ncbi:MAG TPA: T9SS type A sorting domain-containing protein [Chitinophagaceae bacterium]|jgi:hypothetical protein
MKNLFKSTLFGLLSLFALVANAQVPKLHSYPSAAAVIYLDFDGHNVSGTSWNWNGDFYAEAANLTTDQITNIFNRVAEDYQPFEVNVTTDSTEYWSAPANRRMRVILTVTSSWYGSAGGVSYTNSFIWGDNTPCFVFTKLLNNNIKYIAEAASHEAGHTFGLRHQSSYDDNCNKISEYNSGKGSGEIGWAPIMGVGYYQNFTTWHNGPNPYGCNSAQKDLDIITAVIPYRIDKEGNDEKTATDLTLENGLVKTSGMISSPTDVDMFKLNVKSSKNIKLNILPASLGGANTGSNLDIEVALYRQDKRKTSQIANYNPDKILNVNIDTVLDAGTYLLQVKATGNEFSSGYGSLGGYEISEAAPLTVLPLRQLKLNGMADGKQHKFNWIIDADEKVVSQLMEVSTNGHDFHTIGSIAPDDRNFSYQPQENGVLQYRLIVTFDNDRRYYSNIIVMRTGPVLKPSLMGNLITHSQLQVNSPGVYDYIIYDLNGKSISRGKISSGINTLQVPTLKNGFYMIRFSNGHDEWSEKFVSH